MHSEEAKDAARKIGLFYLKKNNNDYEATEQEINKLRITKVDVTDNKVIIITERPGLLIGKRGENIDKLTDALGMEIHIIEEFDPLSAYLIPYDYDKYENEVIDRYYDSLEESVKELPSSYMDEQELNDY